MILLELMNDVLLMKNKSHKQKEIKQIKKLPLDFFKKMYLVSTGYSYSNLGRLFLRLFLGLMLIQFGTRQIYDFRELHDVFPAVLGMTGETSLIVMILIELVCGVFIMFGFLTRWMLLPPFFAMTVALFYLLNDVNTVPPYLISWDNPVYLPVMFLGVIFFILLVGPGKISVDYFLSLNIIHGTNRNEEEELEEI